LEFGLEHVVKLVLGRRSGKGRAARAIDPAMVFAKISSALAQKGAGGLRPLRGCARGAI